MRGATSVSLRKLAIIAAALSAIFLLTPVQADIVVLRNGHRLEGRVVDDGESVVVHTRFGTVKLDRANVERIIPSKTALDEHHERVAELQKKITGEKLDGPAQGKLWYELAQWCQEKDLERAREDMLRRSIAADPDQSQARQALGFIRHQGAWITGAERHQALGLVKYKDRWVTPEARNEAERADTDARKAGLERARAEADLKVRQAEAGKLDAERKLLDAQARSSEVERAQMDREWYELQRERERLYSQRWYYSTCYPYSWSPVVLQPLERTPPALPRSPAPQSGPPYGSQLNNGQSGPSIPLLK